MNKAELSDIIFKHMIFLYQSDEITIVFIMDNHIHRKNFDTLLFFY